MTILYDDEYHAQAYDVCRQMHFKDRLSYGDILEAHGLERGLVLPSASLNSVAIRIAHVFRHEQMFGWCDESTVMDYIEIDGNVVRLDSKRQEMSVHTCAGQKEKEN